MILDLLFAAALVLSPLEANAMNAPPPTSTPAPSETQATAEFLQAAANMAYVAGICQRHYEEPILPPDDDAVWKDTPQFHEFMKQQYAEGQADASKVQTDKAQCDTLLDATLTVMVEKGQALEAAHEAAR